MSEAVKVSDPFVDFMKDIVRGGQGKDNLQELIENTDVVGIKITTAYALGSSSQKSIADGIVDENLASVISARCVMLLNQMTHEEVKALYVD